VGEPTESATWVRCDGFEVNLRTGEVQTTHRKFILQEKPFLILSALLERPGELITRDELKKKLWSSGTFVDFDHSLNKAVNRLREALGDSAEHPRFIETLGSRGYRFVGTVDGSPQAAGAVSEPQAEQPDVLASSTSSTWRRGLAVSALALALIIAAISVTYLAVDRRPPTTDTSIGGIRSLAVLPLDDLSHDPAQSYFADGMTDELITELGQIAALRVISRTSVMQYRGTHKSLPQIARELNVDAVVEGTILRSGDRVRITAQLIQAPMDKHLWAHSYEGNLREVLALQENVAKDIAGQIRAQLTPQERAKLKNARPVNPAAYEAYLRGNYFADKRTAEGLAKAIEYFEEAIRDDPNSAPAYAGLADVYTVISEYKSVPAHESHVKARAAARRAVELDDSLAEAHTELANLAGNEDYDWPGAEWEFRRAIELNPGNATAHSFRAMNLMSMGRWREASAEMERARELDPLSIIINANIGLVYYYSGEPDRAIEAERKALELDPNTAFIYEYLGLAYLQKGMYREAISHLQKAMDLSKGFPLPQAELAYVYAAEGNHAQAGRIRANLQSRSRREFVSSYSLAVACVALGERDAALARLQKAYEEREDQVALLKIEPLFASLHSDLRFRDLLRRTGLYTADEERAGYKK
jgi:TolB-like protein/DNA-binding winged helix-turn-helix (wHTH) protein/Tfp pilus assembly protein PilF